MKKIFPLSFMLVFLTLPLAFAEEGKIEIRKSAVEFALRDNGQGNHDNQANPGETLYLDIAVTNTGSETVEGLRAELSTKDPRLFNTIFFIKNEAFIGDIEGGATVSLTYGKSSRAREFYPGVPEVKMLDSDHLDKAFKFSLEPSCSSQDIRFTVTFQDSQGAVWTDTLVLPVVRDVNSLSWNFSRFSFFASTKMMEGGSIFDLGLGFAYSERFSGDLRLRKIDAAYNDVFEDIDDSLIAAASAIYEVFLLPIEYTNTLARKRGGNSRTRFQIGGGLYYYDEALREKGYFYIEDWDEPLNIYTNDFSLRKLGPLLDLGLIYRGSEWVNLALSAGFVPVFMAWADQRINFIPMISPGAHTQTQLGSPGLYGDLSGMISLPRIRPWGPSAWKFWFSLAYDFTRLRYEQLELGADEAGNASWIRPERTVVSQVFKAEAALLIPLGASIYFQVGGGGIFESITIDANAALQQEKIYYTICARKTFF